MNLISINGLTKIGREVPLFKDVTFGGMQTHIERCQKSQANKSSGWNLVYVAEE